MSIQQVGKSLVEAVSEASCSALFGAGIAGAMKMDPKVGAAIAVTTYLTGLAAFKALEALPTLENMKASLSSFYEMVGTLVIVSSLIHFAASLSQAVLTEYLRLSAPSLIITSGISVSSFLLGQLCGPALSERVCERLGLASK